MADTKIDRELPFAMTMITLMASSGITPYESFRRLKQVDLLPVVMEKSKDIVREVEVLGEDPLTVIEKKADESKSMAFQDLLSGYVSTVRTGGSVVHYLKMKLKSIFELQTAVAKQSIDKLGMLVDAYMSIMIIAMSAYAITISMSSINMPVASMPSLGLMSILLILSTPTLSILFILLANQMRESTLIGVDRRFRIHVIISAITAAAVAAMTLIQPFSGFINQIGLAYVLGISLVSSSIPPIISYERIAHLNRGAEKAMPRFIRSVVETRKTGLSPVRCMIQASRAKNYGSFTKYMSSIADQLEFGIPLRRIFESVRREVSSWPVLINMFILFEVIESGGGFADTLESLAEASEKAQGIEGEKRSMLRPYILLPFVVTSLLAFTTMVMIQSFVSISREPAGFAAQLTTTLSAGIVVQSWLSGFFIGKVTSGAFASGFKYAALLTVVACVSILATSYISFGVGSAVRQAG